MPAVSCAGAPGATNELALEWGRINELEKRAKSSFWKALIGALTCLAPLGIWALVQAFAIKRDAERANERVPRLALVAIILGVLSCFGLAAALVLAYKAQHRHEAAVAAVEARLTGKRDAAVLEETVACDLATEYLLKIVGRDATIKCPVPLTRVSDSAIRLDLVATSSDVDTKLTACILHGARWFVLDADIVIPPCPATLAAPVAATGSAEEGVRATIQHEWELASVATYTETFKKIRAAVRADTHAAKSCPSSLTSGGAADRQEISFVDFDLLNAAAEKKDDPWRFMTKEDARQAIDPNRPDRAKALGKVMSAPALAVFYSETRAWPILKKEEGVIHDTFSYVPGKLEGWMLLVDPRSAQVICEAFFEFSNSDKIKYDNRGSSEESARAKGAARIRIQA